MPRPSATTSCQRWPRSPGSRCPPTARSTAKICRRCSAERRSNGAGRSTGSSTTATASFAIRDGRWKLLADEAFGKARLFDLDADRFEVIDRAAADPAVVKRLLAQLRDRHADVMSDPLRPPKTGGR